MKFTELSINQKLIAITEEQNFSELTVIQEKCLPEIAVGRDVVGQAETGSGKTLAFCLPILDKIDPCQGIQTLVLTPTRELCVQVSDVFDLFGKPLNISTVSIYGGVKIDPQIRRLKKANVVVGTPGRILDHCRRRTINLRFVRFLVLDETDKMFEMGFVDDVEAIIREVPRRRQTLMFSATAERGAQSILHRHLHNPLVIKTQSYVDRSKLTQVYYDIYQRHHKFSLLVHLLRENAKGLSMVFCATRREVDVVSRNLRKQGFRAMGIHGGMGQNKRLDSLDALRDEKINVLVATDVAARGLDVKNVNFIYHYDVPKTPTEYIHRIGRTARAGADGAAITLLTEEDHDNFRRVQDDKSLEIQKADFPAFRQVPLDRRPVKSKQYGRRQRRRR
jgi:ATP-dependent RNA helicase DeaD